MREFGNSTLSYNLLEYDRYGPGMVSYLFSTYSFSFSFTWSPIPLLAFTCYFPHSTYLLLLLYIFDPRYKLTLSRYYRTRLRVSPAYTIVLFFAYYLFL